MAIRRLHSVALLPLLLAGALARAGPEIADVRAHAFCDATGEWSQDLGSILLAEAWDRPEGESLVPCASSAMLLIYVIQAAPGTDLGGHALQLVVTRVPGRAGEEILRETVRLGVTNQEGRLFVPLLLRGHGCDRMRVGAGLSSSSRALVTLLPDPCGE